MSKKVCILLLHNKSDSGLYDYAKIYEGAYPNSKLILLSDLYPQTSQWILFHFFFIFKYRITKKLQKIHYNYDLIHVCDNPIYKLHILKLLDKLKIKTIITIHDPNAHLEKKIFKKLKNLYIYIILKLSFKFIKSSKYINLHLHKKINNKNTNKALIFPHPFYEVEAKSREITKYLTVGFFGRLEYYKGIDIFIELLNKMDKIVGKDQIKVIIAGVGLLPDLSYIKNIKIEVYNYFIDIKLFNNLVSSTDLILLPYRQASQSGVLMKAITYNIPVISNDLEELNMHIVDDVTGKIVDISNLDMWVSELNYFIKNKDILTQFSNNIKKSKSNYNPVIISNSLYSSHN